MGYSPWGHKESDTTERLTLTRCLPRLSWREVQHVCLPFSGTFIFDHMARVHFEFSTMKIRVEKLCPLPVSWQLLGRDCPPPCPWMRHGCHFGCPSALHFCPRTSNKMVRDLPPFKQCARWACRAWLWGGISPLPRLMNYSSL